MFFPSKTFTAEQKAQWNTGADFTCNADGTFTQSVVGRELSGAIFNHMSYTALDTWLPHVWEKPKALTLLLIKKLIVFYFPPFFYTKHFNNGSNFTKEMYETPTISSKEVVSVLSPVENIPCLINQCVLSLQHLLQPRCNTQELRKEELDRQQIL